MTKKELIAVIGGIIGLISFCFGIHFFYDNRFAHAADMTKAVEVIQKIGIRLDYKIVEDQFRAVQQKIWTIEDRYCTDKSKPCDEGKMPQTVKEQYRELKFEQEKLQKELEALRSKK